MVRTIALDFDGVLIDLVTPWLAAYNEAAEDNLRYADIRQYEIHAAVKEAWRIGVYALRSPEVYRRCLPEPGAQAGVAALARAGFRLVVVTKEPDAACRHAKQEVLRKFFPELPLVVVAANKRAVVPSGLLIDDAPQNKPHLLFSQPWNATTPLAEGQQQAANWFELTRLLLA